MLIFFHVKASITVVFLQAVNAAPVPVSWMAEKILHIIIIYIWNKVNVL